MVDPEKYCRIYDINVMKPDFINYMKKKNLNVEMPYKEMRYHYVRFLKDYHLPRGYGLYNFCSNRGLEQHRNQFYRFLRYSGLRPNHLTYTMLAEQYKTFLHFYMNFRLRVSANKAVKAHGRGSSVAEMLQRGYIKDQ